MWQRFKDYLTKTGKNEIDKEKLEQEINKLKTNSETEKPTSKAPWIIGGGIILTLGIGAVLLIRNRKVKNSKK